MIIPAIMRRVMMMAGVGDDSKDDYSENDVESNPL